MIFCKIRFLKNLLIGLLIGFISFFINFNTNISALELPKINNSFNENCYKYWFNINNIESNTFYNLDIDFKNLLDTGGKIIDLNKHNIIATQGDNFLVVKKIGDKFILKTFSNKNKSINLYLYYTCDSPENLNNKINIRYRLYDLRTIKINFFNKNIKDKDSLREELTKNNILHTKTLKKNASYTKVNNSNKYILMFLYFGIMLVLAILIFSVFKKIRN